MNHQTQRIYAMEGSLHLSSSQPHVLTPSDLYQAKSDPAIKKLLADCNLYVIANRRRIYIDPIGFDFFNHTLRGNFVVQRDLGVSRISFEWQVPNELLSEGSAIEVVVAELGTHVCVCLDSRDILVAAHRIVAEATSNLTDEDRDLQIQYIGQGIGKSTKRSAADRLLNHTTFQRILADTVTYTPNAEVLLLLYRFETQKSFISSGGDLNAEPQASCEEEDAHIAKMGTLNMTRHSRIALAEAALIRHFQPWYNMQLKESNFSARRKIKVLEKLLDEDMTGLIVEISTYNIQSRLRTANASPKDLTELFESDVLDGSHLECSEDKQKWADELRFFAHTHVIPFALTTADERDTLMHGMLWNGETVRKSIFRI